MLEFKGIATLGNLPTASLAKMTKCLTVLTVVYNIASGLLLGIVFRGMIDTWNGPHMGIFVLLAFIMGLDILSYTAVHLMLHNFNMILPIISMSLIALTLIVVAIVAIGDRIHCGVLSSRRDDLSVNDAALAPHHPPNPSGTFKPFSGTGYQLGDQGAGKTPNQK